jgi:hypothetical protein
MRQPVSAGGGRLLCSGHKGTSAGSVNPLEVSGGLVDRPQILADQVQVTAVVVTPASGGGLAVGARSGGAGVPVGDGVFERLHPLE